MYDAARKPPRKPFYFGPSGRALFGCYHSPRPGSARDCAVVLCYPWGQEYMRSHRAFLQIAVRLANAGFPVLRFDFYGCGDSAGDLEEGIIVDQWLSDVSTAIDEVRRQSRLAKVSLIGLRLGGALAVLAAAERRDVDSLVLWNPVISGQAYGEELKRLHKDMLRYSYVEPDVPSDGGAFTQILGFSYPSSMHESLRNIDLLTIQHIPANHILLVEHSLETESGRFREHVASIGGKMDYQHIVEDKVWLEDPNRGLVPHRLLQSVVFWMSRLYP